jgi:very-short-patch-repair endonuclease
MANPLARAMRRRMSDAEVRLWVNLRPLRQQGLAFRRQSAIGSYIVDFECRRAMLVVEVDGAQHALTDARAYDDARTRWLEDQGYAVLRFWNDEVLRSTDSVVEHVVRTAKERGRALDRRNP